MNVFQTHIVNYRFIQKKKDIKVLSLLKHIYFTIQGLEHYKLLNLQIQIDF